MNHAAALSNLSLRSVSCIPVEVPMRYVLGTSAATIRAAPLLLVEVLTGQGVIGLEWDSEAVARYRIA